MNYELKAWLAAATLPVWATAALWYDSARIAGAMAGTYNTVASAWMSAEDPDDDTSEA